MRVAALCEFDPARIRHVERWLAEMLEICRDGRREPLPKVVGEYTVGKLLAQGGFGVVHRGERADTHAPVVLKFLDPRRSLKTSDLKEVFDDFWAEAGTGRALFGVNGSAAILDAGFDPETGWAYLVLDDVSGETLDEWATRRRTVTQVVRLVADVCAAVSRMHALGFWHRDLKPRNLLVTSDQSIRILDFGLAAREDAEPKAAGRISGTPGYMAPEQANGEPAGPLNDQYSLGVILTELLGLPARRPSVDSELIRVATRATEYDPQNRHPTVARMEAELRGWLSDNETVVLVTFRENGAVRTRDRHADVLLHPANSEDEAERLFRQFGPSLPEFDHDTTPRSDHNLTVARHVAQQLTRWDRRSLLIARFLARLSRHLIGQGGLREPAFWYTRAADMTRAETDRDIRLERAIWLNEYGCLQWMYGQTKNGLNAAREVYEVRLELLGPDTVATNQALNNLAEAYRRVGNEIKAARLHKQSFKTAEHFNPKDDEFAWRCGNWGNMLAQTGHALEAQHVIKQGIDIRSRLLGPDHPDVCFLLNHFAAALDRKTVGQHSDAMKAFERSRRIRDRVFGEDSVAALRVRNLQIESHMAHNEWEAALKLAGFFTDLPFVGDRIELARGLENYLAVCGQRRLHDRRVAEFRGRILAIRAFVRG